jgi:opacity protein-like surface antigen
MKSLALAVLAIALFALAVPAHAEPTHWFGYSVGAGYPQGDLHEWATHGYNMGVTYTYMMNRALGVGGELGYSRWTNSQQLDDEVEAFYGSGSEFKQTDWSYTLHGVVALPLPGPVQPYAKAGVGYFNPKAAAVVSDTLWGTRSHNYFGHLVGGGVSIAVVPNIRFNAEGSLRQYRDSQLEQLVRYWSVTGQVLWHMKWSNKL